MIVYDCMYVHIYMYIHIYIRVDIRLYLYIYMYIYYKWMLLTCFCDLFCGLRNSEDLSTCVETMEH